MLALNDDIYAEHQHDRGAAGDLFGAAEPDQRWWNFWQQLLVGSGDRDAAARLFT